MTNQQEAGGGVGLTSKRPEMAGGQAGQVRQDCAGCGKPISDRYMLRALDMLWHEDCLKCGCCDCRLGEVGSTLYTKANLILCKRDYLRLFGSTGYCSACNKVIPAFEMVMRARNNVYHLECFACQQCNHRFCVGDKFYLCDNKILCEYDYEERLVFASMTFNPTAIAHIKRSTTHLPVSNSEGSCTPRCAVTTSVDVTSAGGLRPPPVSQQYSSPAASSPAVTTSLNGSNPVMTSQNGAALPEMTSLGGGFDSPESPLLDK